jgi:hypothetical protein
MLLTPQNEIKWFALNAGLTDNMKMKPGNSNTISKVIRIETASIGNERENVLMRPLYICSGREEREG